jgi:hypothetical protein
MGVILVVVTKDELRELWEHSGMAAVYASGAFIEDRRPGTPTGDPALPGAVSQIVVIKTSGGQHVGTIYEVRDASGTQLEEHTHPVDYRDCFGTKWTRCFHEPRHS